MRLLFLGDVFAKMGREVVARHLPGLKREFAPDIVIANAENSAHGFGISVNTAKELFSCGIDVLTGGNHSWDRADIIPFIQREPNLIRPANGLNKDMPGAGSVVFTLGDGRRVLVINILCSLFMNSVESPFACLDRLLPECAPGEAGLDAIFVDCHGEASSEKRALGHYVDGRVSAIIGTHTHVPTADAYIQPAGSGYQSDAGMCGNYDSVIGMDKDISLARFLDKIPRPRFQPAEGKAGVCGVCLETDPISGLCRSIVAFSRGCPWPDRGFPEDLTVQE